MKLCGLQKITPAAVATAAFHFGSGRKETPAR
jgi:hypothetical protein